MEADHPTTRPPPPPTPPPEIIVRVTITTPTSSGNLVIQLFNSSKSAWCNRDDQ